MSRQQVSLPMSASVQDATRIFGWVFTACALVTPMFLIVYAFLTSPDAIERAQIVVQGLESTTLSLAAALVLGAAYRLGVHGGSAQRETSAPLAQQAASA